MVRRQEQPFSDADLQELEWGQLAMYEPGVLSRKVPPRHWDRDKREQWAVSDEALRSWARREGLDPEAVVDHEHERFRGGRGAAPPPRVVWVDPERVARGTYRTPSRSQSDKTPMGRRFPRSMSRVPSSRARA